MKTSIRTKQTYNIGEKIYLIGTGQFFVRDDGSEHPSIKVQEKELPRDIEDSKEGVVTPSYLSIDSKLTSCHLVEVYPELSTRFERVEAEIVGEIKSGYFFNTYEVKIATKPTKRDVAGRKKKLEKQSQFIRGILETHGLTQRKFAREIGVTTSTVASWLNNRSLMDDFNESRVNDFIRKLEDK